MPFINGGHIWLILGLIVLLVVFGPGKLPELGTAVGKTIKAFKKSTEDLKAEMSLKDVEPAVEAPRTQVVHSEPVHSETGRTDLNGSEPVRGDRVQLEG
ncbi:MAG: twin-arginine translocase TatA/TatE family subunit [Candidatus Dormibacteraceae bacterium]